MNEITRNYTYWPGMDHNIEDMVCLCGPCATATKQPLKALVASSNKTMGAHSHRLCWPTSGKAIPRRRGCLLKIHNRHGFKEFANAFNLPFQCPQAANGEGRWIDLQDSRQPNAVKIHNWHNFTEFANAFNLPFRHPPAADGETEHLDEHTVDHNQETNIQENPTADNGKSGQSRNVFLVPSSSK
jgi:hypothetical protein